MVILRPEQVKTEGVIFDDPFDDLNRDWPASLGKSPSFTYDYDHSYIDPVYLGYQTNRKGVSIPSDKLRLLTPIEHFGRYSRTLD